MRKLVTILKYTFVLIVILLFTMKKPNQNQSFHSVRFTDNAFAGQSQSEDSQIYNINIKDLEKGWEDNRGNLTYYRNLPETQGKYTVVVLCGADRR